MWDFVEKGYYKSKSVINEYGGYSIYFLYDEKQLDRYYSQVDVYDFFGEFVRTETYKDMMFKDLESEIKWKFKKNGNKIETYKYYDEKYVDLYYLDKNGQILKSISGKDNKIKNDGWKDLYKYWGYKEKIVKNKYGGYSYYYISNNTIDSNYHSVINICDDQGIPVKVEFYRDRAFKNLIRKCSWKKDWSEIRTTIINKNCIYYDYFNPESQKIKSVYYYNGQINTVRNYKYYKNGNKVISYTVFEDDCIIKYKQKYNKNKKKIKDKYMVKKELRNKNSADTCFKNFSGYNISVSNKHST